MMPMDVPVVWVCADACMCCASAVAVPQRSQFADKMAPKADVEGAVNPVGHLEEDDDPFLVRHCMYCLGVAVGPV